MIHNLLRETGLIVILRGVSREALVPCLDALMDGGVKLAEITYTFDRPELDAQVADCIALAAKHTAGRMLIGAGTVTRKEQVTLTKNAGGQFIISPDTNREIIAFTKENGLTSMPGAMTVSETVAALQAGADYIKVFPAGVLGIEYIKALRGPLPGAKLLAVGGVSTEEIATYRAAGCMGFGVGGNIVNKALCDAGKFDEIRENAKRFAEVCK